MTRCVFGVPGDLATPAGGYLYARKILPLLARRLSIEVCQLPAGFPLPSKTEAEEARTLLGRLDAPGTVFLIDGLAYGALTVSAIEALKQPVVALVHHPLGLEEGLSPSEKALLLKTEREALELARHIVVPSYGTGRELMHLFRVAADKFTVAEPGILRGKRAEGASDGMPPLIVSVGSLTPRKGFPVLIDALNEVRDLPWRATIAGSADLSPETAALVQRKLSDYGFDNRVQVIGQLDETRLSALYSSAGVFRARQPLRRLWHGIRGGDCPRLARCRVGRGRGARPSAPPPQALFAPLERQLPSPMRCALYSVKPGPEEGKGGRRMAAWASPPRLDAHGGQVRPRAAACGSVNAGRTEVELAGLRLRRPPAPGRGHLPDGAQR